MKAYNYKDCNHMPFQITPLLWNDSFNQGKTVFVSIPKWHSALFEIKHVFVHKKNIKNIYM